MKRLLAVVLAVAYLAWLHLRDLVTETVDVARHGS